MTSPRRPWALLAVWVVGAVLATGVGVFAVGQVREQVSDPVAAPLVARDVDRALATASPTASRSPRPRATATATARPHRAPVVRTARLKGGTVGVSCSGSTPTLLYATPADGWRLDESSRTATRLEVRFTAGEARSKVEAACSAGGPVFELDERSD